MYRPYGRSSFILTPMITLIGNLATLVGDPSTIILPINIETIFQNLNKMKQTWLDECERASIAASNMNLVSPRSVRTMTPALTYQPPPCYAAGDYDLPLAGSNLPRPNKYELKRTLSTRSVGPQVSFES